MESIDMTRRAVSTPGHRKRLIGALLVVTTLGALLRFQGLGVRDFWFDESCTFIYVHNLFDWPANSDLLVESTNLPYYLLLRGWTWLWGDSEAAYRSLSALASALTVPLLTLVALRLGGVTAALACAFFAALNPLQIHYAHEARAYALWVLLLAALLSSLSKAGRSGRRRDWIATGLLTLICLHLHYFTLYLLPATASVVFLAQNRKRALRGWVITTSLVALAFVPYFLAAAWPASRGGGGSWISPYFDAIGALPHSLWAFLPAGAYPAHLRGLSLASPDTVRFSRQSLIIANGISRALPAAITISMVLFIVIRAFKNSSDKAASVPLGRGNKEIEVSTGSSHLFLAGMTLGPLVVAWLYSVVVRPNYLVGRYDLVAWPAFVVWLGLIVAEFTRRLPTSRQKPAAMVIVGVLSACSVMPITRMAALRPPSTFHHERARYLAAHTDEKSLVVALNYDRDYLLYYLHRHGFKGRIVSFPSWLDRQIGWVDTDADLAAAREGLVEPDAKRLTESILQVLDAGGKVFLLLDSLDPNDTGKRAPLQGLLTDQLTQAGLMLTVADERTQVLTVGR